METRPLANRVAAITALDDPVRRRLFDVVSSSPTPIGRDEAARRLGLNRSTTAFHLDRLAGEGLLSVKFKRLSGKTGPGSGRPSKLYHRALGEITVSIPERNYELAGDLMATAIEIASRSGESARDALLRITGETGRAIGAKAGTLEKVLKDNGYEPQLDDAGDTVMGNCPFHRLVEQHSEIVCALNVELLRGAVDGIGDTEHAILHEPDSGRCCVKVAMKPH
jgi:predicted ArsR family transcriptional regulator